MKGRLHEPPHYGSYIDGHVLEFDPTVAPIVKRTTWRRVVVRGEKVSYTVSHSQNSMIYTRSIEAFIEFGSSGLGSRTTMGICGS